MKPFTNLPGNLRAFFGFLRFSAVLMGCTWVCVMTFNFWIQKNFTDHPKFIVTVGNVALPVSPNALGLNSDSAKAGSLELTGAQGTLQVDLLSNDAALVSAVRWTIFPSMALFVAFSFLLFGSLRNLCANIEQRDLFSEKNLRLVRDIGLILISYSLAGFVVQFWAHHEIGGYLRQHVALTGIESGMPFSGGPGMLDFRLSSGQFPDWTGLVTGCLVLMLSEVFRQGLNLKTESDLTV